MANNCAYAPLHKIGMLGCVRSTYHDIFVSPVSTNIITLPQQPIITHFLHKLIFGILHKMLGF